MLFRSFALDCTGPDDPALEREKIGRQTLIALAITLAVCLIMALIWFGIKSWQNYRDTPKEPLPTMVGEVAEQMQAEQRQWRDALRKKNKPAFQCDGRRYCSQMRSLEEARFFLRHCPNTEMDGDGDGKPCENDTRWNKK